MKRLDFFLKQVAEQFDETPTEQITADCDFKGLEEWSSMLALAIIAMVDEKFGVSISGDDIRNAFTFTDLFEVVVKKVDLRK